MHTLNRLRPFWSYYGGKWRNAKHYPAPTHSIIVEPFAGAAGYSLTYSDRQVVLTDASPKIAALWDWLISVSVDDVRSLPIDIGASRIDELNIPVPAQTWIGHALNPGGSDTRPRKNNGWNSSPDRMRQMNTWSQAFVDRAVAQLPYIRHWMAGHASYRELPDIEGTWFIDPPYQGRAGAHYPFGSKRIDYADLADWCQTRRGQVIVCEAEGATWLPFQRLGVFKANKASNRTGRSAEVIWTK